MGVSRAQRRVRRGRAPPAEARSRRNREAALAILAGVDGIERTPEEAAAQALAVGLGYRWSAVSRRSADGQQARVLAFWDDGEYLPAYNYDLAGTPCAEIPPDGRIAYLESGVAAAFPADVNLTRLGAEAYQGRLVYDPETAGIVGHIAAFDDRPDPEGADDLVEMVARWVGLHLGRLAAIEALRASEERFRDLAAISYDWFWETDAAHRFTQYQGNNPVLPDGTPVERSIGVTPWELAGADPDSVPFWRGHKETLERHETFRDLSLEVRDGDGRRAVLLVSGAPVFREDGTFLGYRGTTRDITQQVLAREQAAASDLRFREVLENTPVANAITGVDSGTVYYANRKWLELCGVDASEIGSVRILEFYSDPDERARLLGMIRRDGAVNGVRTTFRTREGREIPGLVSAVPTEYAGEPAMVTGWIDMTEQVAAQDALRESEERYALAMQAAGESLWDWRADEEERYLDPRMLRAMGLSDDPPRVGPDVFIERVHPDDRAHFERQFAELFADRTRSGFDVEFRLRMAGGEYRWLRGRALALRDADGRVHRVAGSIGDITEQRTAQNALRESEERYALAMAGASEHLWDWRAGDDRIVTDPRVLANMGLPEDPPILDRHYLIDAIHPDDRKRYEAEFRAHLRGDTPEFDVEYRLRMADGGYRWHRTRGVGLRGETGRIERVAGSTTDISARKAAEEALRESEARYRHVFEAGPAGMALYDLDLRYSMVNDQFCAILGYERDELIGRQIAEITHPDDLPVNRSTFDRLLEAAEGQEAYRKRYLRKDGETVHAEVVSALIRDADGAPLYGLSIVQDVTERLRAEEAIRERDDRLQALQSELLRVSRASAMGEMASAIAHEVNQPLSAVMNYVQAARDLLESPRADDPVPSFLDKATDQAERAATIVRRLRNFFVRGELERRSEDLNDVVEEAVSLALGRHEADRPVLDLDLAEGLPAVEIDRVQLQQVVVNLVQNAVEAMDGSPGARVGVSTARDGEDVAVAVRDVGPGIAPDIRERLFTPFVTSKASGMGMGLSISASIVQAHGGVLDARDAEGGGTEFRLTLPVKAA